MHFHRTTASIFQAAREIHVEREHEIARLLCNYEAELESSRCPDKSVLYRAKRLLEEKLTQAPIDWELVELGHFIYSSLGEWPAEIAMLRAFLRKPPLSLDEQAWARWRIVDCLSLMGSANESVKEQQAFFQWATTVFPLEECFFVISDGTQARSWFEIGRCEEWFALLDHLLDQAPKTAQNRLDRFYSLRTAIHLSLELSESERTQCYMSALQALSQEDPAWLELRWTEVERAILAIAIADRDGHVSLVRSLAQKATEHLGKWEEIMNIHDLSERRRFRSLCHNLAAPLYRARHYDLAIPLFQKAVEYHTNPYYSYLWLAASLWHTTHQKEKVFPYLQQAAARYDGQGNPWDTFQLLPEFEDVRDDPEFQRMGTVFV